MPKTLHLRVSKIDRETPDAITLHFPQPQLHKIWYKAGQYLSLAVKIEGETYFRSYSLCSAPRLDDTLAITVKRLPGGKVSNYLNDEAKVGDTFIALRPGGRFFVENSVKYRRHLVLLGAGSGITPLFSILRSVLFNEPRSAVTLINANRDKEHIIFHRSLQELQGKFPDRLRVIHQLSQPKEPLSPPYRKGRMESKVTVALLEEIERPAYEDTQYYLCGPEGLMQLWQAELRAKGIPESEIHQEHFVLEEDAPETELLKQERREVTIIQGETHHRFEVAPGASILEAALTQEIDLPYSCRRGICSTCRGKLLQGEVHMRRNQALTDWDLEKGYVLVCQSLPQSEGVTIEI
jgi:ring-1,2-phenylacetyl-CoA epoxidase subunit PaaE